MKLLKESTYRSMVITIDILTNSALELDIENELLEKEIESYKSTINKLLLNKNKKWSHKTI